jgi:K+-sensing histidine kinase KdpD
VAVLGPVVVALLLTPWRDRLAAADNALILVVVIVAVATAGYRWAAAVCALASALAFDVFLTRRTARSGSPGPATW